MVGCAIYWSSSNERATMFDEYRAKQAARRESARADLRRLRDEVKRDAREAFAPVAEQVRENRAVADRRVAEQLAEHDRLVAVRAPDGGVLAEHCGVVLYPDRITYRDESRPLAGVRARVEEHRTGQEWGGWDQKNVWLTISGPGFEWPVRTNAIVSSRKARWFAALVNGAGSTAGPAGGNGPAVDVAGQLAQLAELHRSGALTDEEYAAAKSRTLAV